MEGRRSVGLIHTASFSYRNLGKKEAGTSKYGWTKI